MLVCWRTLSGCVWHHPSMNGNITVVCKYTYPGVNSTNDPLFAIGVSSVIQRLWLVKRMLRPLSVTSRQYLWSCPPRIRWSAFFSQGRSSVISSVICVIVMLRYHIKYMYMFMFIRNNAVSETDKRVDVAPFGVSSHQQPYTIFRLERPSCKSTKPNWHFFLILHLPILDHKVY